MHTKLLLRGILSFILFVMIASGCRGRNNSFSPVDEVDPLIGSGGHGHVFVGASVPWGMVQVGPQNIYKGWDWCSGYHYSDSVMIGFSHTHLSGTGCADLGDVQLMPFTGRLRSTIGTQSDLSGSTSSYYRHEKETVRPGFYSVTMENGIGVELTATERGAIHRYVYPKQADTLRVLVNLKEGNGDQAYETFLRMVDDRTIEGYRFSKGWSPDHKVFFVIKSNRPINRMDLFREDKLINSKGKAEKGVLTWASSNKRLELRIALSSVSCANARMNMEQEIGSKSFDQVKSEAKQKWNDQLRKVEVKSKDARQRRIFYTSLFHTMIAPTLYCDVNGEYRGHDDRIYRSEGWKNYSTFSLWDTYRTLNPLYTVLAPEKVSDWVNSFLSIYDQQGCLPIWALTGGETDCMPGYSSIQIIADAYLKGIKGFDTDRALRAVLETSNSERQSAKRWFLQKGYIPCDRQRESVSYAMEYAVSDWGIAQMAKRMEREDIYNLYNERGQAYLRYFDRSINFVRPIMDDGTWRTPYDPFNSIHMYGDFCEGTGWQYSFFVPQNPEGLIELMGGDALFVQKLDSLFLVEGDMGAEKSADISGLIGQYAHGNEPSHHIAYLYAYAGQQWKTAEWIARIQKDFYTDGVDGIIGNEDCGQMSAWHVLSAMGFYQVNPSNGVFVFGTPLFEEITLNLSNNKKFVVKADRFGVGSYIHSAYLNGEEIHRSYITYSEIMAGGELKFVMSNRPNREFGQDPTSRPQSR